MLHSLDELSFFARNMKEEIRSAAEGKENSIAFSRNPLPKTPLVIEGEVFQVIMMGGSHLESVKVRVIGKSVEILDFHEEDLPKLSNKEIVCSIFAKHLLPGVKVVSFNFAYPLEAVEREGFLDGVLLAAPKEHRFDGLIGKTIGQEIELYIKSKLQREVKITVSNDTTALGMASIDCESGYDWSNTMVGVIGTGINFGLFEDAHSFINLESGNFDKFEQTPEGKTIDQVSNDPGFHKFEKEISGGYLCKHFNLIAQEKGLSKIIKTTQELSEIAAGESEESWTARSVIERSASLAAVQIKGIYDYKRELLGVSNDFQMLALIEGSLYWKGYHYKEYVNKYLELFGILDSIKVVHIDKVGIVGSAKLAA
jgi:hexokinase